MGHPTRLEPTLAGLLVKLANHYTARGALESNLLWLSGRTNGRKQQKTHTSTGSWKQRWRNDKATHIILMLCHLQWWLSNTLRLVFPKKEFCFLVEYNRWPHRFVLATQYIFLTSLNADIDYCSLQHLWQLHEFSPHPTARVSWKVQ